MSDNVKPVSAAELELLKALWTAGPSTVRAVQSALGKGRARRKWAYTTVQTLLGRLVQKGYVKATKEGRAFVFEAAVAQDELLDRELQDVADRVCDGMATPLVLALVERNQFTADDIRKMREMLDRIEGGTLGEDD